MVFVMWGGFYICFPERVPHFPFLRFSETYIPERNPAFSDAGVKSRIDLS